MLTMLPDRTSHDWTPVANLHESSRSEIDVEEYLLGTDSDEPPESQGRQIAHASTDPEGLPMALPHAPVHTIRSAVASPSLLSEAPSLFPPMTRCHQESFCDDPVLEAVADGSTTTSGRAMDVGKADRYCHHCRNKRARTEVMVCTSGRSPKHRRGLCGLSYCRNCINSRYGRIIFRADQDFNCPRCCDACLCTICTSKRGEAYEGPRRSDSKRAFLKRRADNALSDSESDPTQRVSGSLNKRRKLPHPSIPSASALPQATNERSPLLDP